MKNSIILVFAAGLLVLASCTPPPPAVTYPVSELKYRLLDAYPDYFWCDPDYFPVGSPEREKQNALDQFGAIAAANEEFTAILKRLSLNPKSGYTTEEMLLIYRQHKLLARAVEMTPSAAGFAFSLRTGQNQGWHITGTITSTGVIQETKREASFNTCPICLAAGTLIDTPLGALAVEQLRPGMPVWMLDVSGHKTAAPILRVSDTPVPLDFKILRLALSDGRIITASPGHPSAYYRPLGEYHTGDTLDGAMVVNIESVVYTAGATYDLLPGGGTGMYWANGVLLLSTLPVVSSGVPAVRPGN